MYEFNGHLINPKLCSVVSPVAPVKLKNPGEHHEKYFFAFWCAVDGQRINVMDEDQYKVITLRDNLIQQVLGKRSFM